MPLNPLVIYTVAVTAFALVVNDSFRVSSTLVVKAMQRLWAVRFDALDKGEPRDNIMFVAPMDNVYT